MSIQLILLFSLIATANIATSHHHHHKPTNDTYVLPENLRFLWWWTDHRPLFIHNNFLKGGPRKQCRILVSSFAQLACGGIPCTQNSVIIDEICYSGLKISRVDIRKRCC
ncbi:unnamed protein product [Caenorhabditis brenneri]